MNENIIQKFGGEHTEIKLNILNAYIKSYLTVMKNQTWANLFYVDAFAGSGKRDDKNLGIQDGSPKRILKENLTFKHYYFNDINREYVTALEKMVRRDFPQKADRVSIKCDDANSFITKFINNFMQDNSNRAVIFLDPYGMQINWQTIKTITNARGIDLFYLFPMHALKRQAAKNMDAISQDKKDRVTNLLGTDAWLTECYKDDPQVNLFDEENIIRKENNALDKFVKSRFANAGFSWVSEPTELKGQKNYHEFSLFFAMTNKSGGAINLAQKLHDGVVKSLAQLP